MFFRTEDYRSYLRLMADWCGKHQVSVWAYCLMPNHVHLVMVPETASGLARAVGEAHRRYTLRINHWKGWRGYLWQGRFALFPMDEKYLLAAVRYVELNPVRAELAKTAWEYPWSSAQAHARGADDMLVKVGPMLNIAGNWQEYLGQESTDMAMNAIRNHSRTGRPLGSAAFIEVLERKLKRLLKRQKPGPMRSPRH